MKRRLMALGLGAALVATSCSNDPSASGPPRFQLVSSLARFGQCDEFLDYVKEQASDQVGPYGMGGFGYGGVMPMMEGDVSTRSAATVEPAFSADEGAATGGADAAPPNAAPGTASTAGDGAANAATNNQEADVDEADLIKIDGNRIVTARANEVVVTELRGGVPVITGRVRLTDSTAERLFLLGDRAYVLGSAVSEDGLASSSVPEGRMVAPIGGMWAPRSAINEIALAGTPTITSTTTVDGQILDGRMVDGTLRLVLSSTGGTRLGFVMPSDGTTSAVSNAEATNRRVLDESTAQDWLPAVTTGSTTRPLLDCANTYHPAEFSGLSMLSVITIADGLDSLTATGVLADSQITYASSERLYVATNRWVGQDDPTGRAVPSADDALEHTDVHAFDIGGTKAAEYLASGRVDGQVLNQYSMSDAAGRLRIATTVTTATSVPSAGDVEPVDPDGAVSSCAPDAVCDELSVVPAPAPAPATDSRISVLEARGDALEIIGTVTGLGPGESIQSVRYVGDLAYVVTFRQTDPFYVVDLSDPTKPRTLGELKVPGFSAYLHPVGERLVFGVGSDADADGRITGAKVSLYDTTDPVAPREVATWTSSDLSFMTDGDPKAFHFDDERDLVFLPYYGSCWSDVCATDAPQNGVMVFRVDPAGITEVGRIDHRDRTPGTPGPEEPTTTTTVVVPDSTTTVPEPTTTTAPEPTTTTAPDTTTAPTTTPTTTIVEFGDAERQSTGAAASAEPGAIEPSPPIVCGPAVDCVGPIGPIEPIDVVYPPTITRVFVVGDVVVTLSEAGIATHDVATLTHRGFAAF